MKQPSEAWLRKMADLEEKHDPTCPVCGLMAGCGNPGQCPARRGDVMSEATGTEARVIADIAERQQKGIAKYNTTVEGNPLPVHEWVRHAYEECLDQAVYLRRVLEALSPPDEEEAS